MEVIWKSSLIAKACWISVVSPIWAWAERFWDVVMYVWKPSSLLPSSCLIRTCLRMLSSSLAVFVWVYG